jgi:hypothetical protein
LSIIEFQATPISCLPVFLSVIKDGTRNMNFRVLKVWLKQLSTCLVSVNA